MKTKNNPTVTKEVVYGNMTLVITVRAYAGRFGQVYLASDDSGEPVMSERYFSTPEEAIADREASLARLFS